MIMYEQVTTRVKNTYILRHNKINITRGQQIKHTLFDFK